MTDEQMQNVRDDIAFMRALAAEGQRTPLLGGAILVAAGVIFGLASLAYWAMLEGVLRLDENWGSMIIWMGALAVFLVALTILNMRVGRKPGARSPANRASGTAWMAVGFSIFAMGVSYAVAAVQLRSEEVMATFPSVIFALYGAGWAVAAAMTGKRWLWAIAFGSWLMAPILAWLSGLTLQFILYAAALFLLMAAPGFALMREEPSDIV